MLPSLIWHLYDYYLQPAGGYFGVKKGCEPLHVQYSYDDRGIEVVNSRYESESDLKVTADLYDFNLHKRFSREIRINVAADSVARALILPEEAFTLASPIYFVRLTLANRDGEIVSTNFYWLSSKSSIYDWKDTTYKYTPVLSYEDFTALQSLPRAGSMNISVSLEEEPQAPAVRVKLTNPSDKLAFQIHLAIQRKGTQEDILPVLWQDNYLELMPGETREVTARYLTPDALRGPVELRVTGWNIEPASITPAAHGGSR